MKSAEKRGPTSYPNTPDGRYFVVRGRLWRLSNPALTDDVKDSLVKDLMAARRDVGDADAEWFETLERQHNSRGAKRN
jgi:hypothetical protein